MGTDSDYHSGCDSLVRITPEDLTGPFNYLFEWADHPDVPEAKVGSCELAAEHAGPCEMFVDASAHTGDTKRYWLNWHGTGRSNRVCTSYEWITANSCCDVESANSLRCTRPVSHRGGHSFTVSGSPT
jgi:hypothetical protein